MPAWRSCFILLIMFVTVVFSPYIRWIRSIATWAVRPARTSVATQSQTTFHQWNLSLTFPLSSLGKAMLSCAPQYHSHTPPIAQRVFVGWHSEYWLEPQLCLLHHHLLHLVQLHAWLLQAEWRFNKCLTAPFGTHVCSPLGYVLVHSWVATSWRTLNIWVFLSHMVFDPFLL